MSAKLNLMKPVPRITASALRKRDGEATHALTELNGVRVGEIYVTTDKRLVRNGYEDPREVIGLRVNGGVSEALLTGYAVTTWVKIDTYKGTVNGYRMVSNVWSTP